MDYDFDQLFPNRFLKSGLFKGKAVTLTIADVAMEDLPDAKEKTGKKAKPIMTFKESPLELVLNRTNAECFKGMFGRNTKDWRGKRVVLYPRMVKAFGQKRQAIRVFGSPDIKADVVLQFQVGQSEVEVTMKKTDAKNKAAPAPEPEMEEEIDETTGEVLEGGDLEVGAEG